MKKAFTNHEEFEKLINYKASHYFENERGLHYLSDRDVGHSVMYQQALRMLYVIIFKNCDAEVGEYIEMTKSIL